ncbi:hypothetical protein [Usitatibacter rugosus]|uniref:hypothetical protein n=1 Tax=Usitatibacter rugosus TaxID=2732067 RepID=UPI001488A2F5|nr:hypothetical protein [Usitatibacter rugosus]
MSSPKTDPDPMPPSAPAPNECTDRAGRLAAVKFVGLSRPEPAPQPPPRDSLLTRFVDLLAVARR